MAKDVSVTVCPGFSVDDGKKKYLPGKTLKLEKEEAESLIERGIVALSESKESDEKKTKKK